jgi:uncharacterized membrane protein
MPLSARSERLLIAIGGMAIQLAYFLIMQPNWSWGIALGLFFAICILASRRWNARATLEEKRADLEDRVRNPPS